MDDWLEIVVKIVVYIATLIVVGVVGVRLVLVRVQSRAALLTAVDPQLESLFARAAALLLLACLARAWAHTATAFGVRDAFRLSNLYAVAVTSRWAAGWHLQVLCALMLAGAAGWARGARASRAGVGVASVVALGVCFALPRTGHAAAESLGWLLHGVHVLGAGLWAGTLACVLLVRGPGVREAQPILLRAFAPVAVTAVAVLGAAGAAAAWIHLGSVEALWTSGYGRVLSVKLLLVLTMGVLGGVNWRALRRHTTPGLPKSVAWEAALSMLVVMLSGWLTEMPHP